MDLPPARSARIGRPPASANDTAPVVRSTFTRSRAVAIVATSSVFVSFQAGVVQRFGAAISDGRAKNASSGANATRTTSSVQTSMRRRPPATTNVGEPWPPPCAMGLPAEPGPRPWPQASSASMSAGFDNIVALHTAQARPAEA